MSARSFPEGASEGSSSTSPAAIDLPRAWWQDAVVYQIYPRSFCDTSGNGVGDLAGIRGRLDHLAWLGVDALWLSPMFPSPMADHGYDVADYCDVDPLFGDLAELDRLVADARERGLRVLLDWVPCHTSDEHPWFREARSSRDHPRRNWYIWRDGDPDRPPNDWRATFPEGPAWTWDDEAGAWYYHRFTPRQPDLNWAEPDVRRAMHDTVRFWLDRGIDGFRIDVIHHLGKDPTLVESGERRGPSSDLAGPTDSARTHQYIRELRQLFDGYPGDRVMVGEVYILDVDEAASHVGRGPDGDELHLGFNFIPLFLPWEAGRWRDHISQVDAAYAARGAVPTWALGSHDIPRLRTRLGTEARARAAAVMGVGLRGAAFLYAGDELGLEDADVPPALVQDPAGFRDGCRAPIPWTGAPGHGWAGTEPWLPWPPDAARRNAADLRDDPASVLHLYRRLLAARRESPALRWGDQVLDVPEAGSGRSDVVAWERRWSGDDGEQDRRFVAVNFADEPCRFDPGDAAAGGWVIEVASDGVGEGERYGGGLDRSQAVVLRPLG